MKLYKKIIKEFRENAISFNSNDNISDHLEEGELSLIEKEVEENVESLLQSLLIDTENDHNTKNTARRIAKMYIHEIFAGRYKPVPAITSFPNVGYENIYTCGPITIRSTCAHHFQNIVGKCWVGVFPEKEVIGLSKFNRIVDHIASRPQIQEEMTTQIATALKRYAKTENIAVIVKAEHHCMTHRGVREHETDMTTSIMSGEFRTSPHLKQEFYDLCFNMKGHR